MPNYCQNVISILNEEFTDEQVNQIKHDFLRRDRHNGKLELDFNLFVPQCYPMINIAINDDIITRYSAFYHYNPLQLDDLTMREVLSNNRAEITVDGENVTAQNFIDDWYKDNYKNLKFDLLPNWYDWNNKRWGTKWNACRTYVTKNGIYFETAWNGVSDELIKSIFTKLKDIVGDDNAHKLVYEAREEGFEYFELIKFDDIMSSEE